MTLLDGRVHFYVLGQPSPQAGTKTVPVRSPSGGTVYRKISEGGAGLASWRQEVAQAARARAEECGCLDGPLSLDVVFRFSMPASRPRWAKVQGVVPKDTAPDLDKLLRAVGDSLKAGGLVRDDARIASITATKVEVWEQWTGASITLRRIDARYFQLASERHPRRELL